MSDTPRTDQMEQHAYWFDDDMTPVCESRLVRPLERELNAEKQHITELEGRLRVLWDKLESERRHHLERIRQLELAGNAMYAFINPPSVSMRTTRMDNLLQGWDDAQIGKEVKP